MTCTTNRPPVDIETDIGTVRCEYIPAVTGLNGPYWVATCEAEPFASERGRSPTKAAKRLAEMIGGTPTEGET